MSFERESSIGPEQEAAIADFFREADRGIARHPDVFLCRVIEYAHASGGVNFADLERVFRRQGFNAHQLAVPSSALEVRFPGFVVSDVNVLLTKGIIVPSPFGVVTCRSMGHLEEKAASYNVKYDPAANLKNLNVAGDLVKRPQ